MRLATTPQVPAVRDPLAGACGRICCARWKPIPRAGVTAAAPARSRAGARFVLCRYLSRRNPANLDYLVEMQGDDGGAPVWSWAPLDAAAWAQAEREVEGRADAGGAAAAAWGRIER